MRSELEKRISRLEKRAVERIEKPKICNCRISTRYHNAACLEALLKGLTRVCPLHGFRVLGTFWFTPSWYVLRRRGGDRDNELCPCPPHPWRSHVLNGPRTWEAQAAAREAWDKLSRDAPPIDPEERKRQFQENSRRIDTLVEGYLTARAEWVEKSGRQPASRAEILKQGREGVPRFTGR